MPVISPGCTITCSASSYEGLKQLARKEEPVDAGVQQVPMTD